MKNTLLKNDFSFIQFPDAKNLLQFFKAGMGLLQYRNSSGIHNDPFTNILLHGEYRNLTRNQKMGYASLWGVHRCWPRHR